jgi:hypothetical protein
LALAKQLAGVLYCNKGHVLYTASTPSALAHLVGMPPFIHLCDPVPGMPCCLQLCQYLLARHTGSTALQADAQGGLNSGKFHDLLWKWSQLKFRIMEGQLQGLGYAVQHSASKGKAASSGPAATEVVVDMPVREEEPKHPVQRLRQFLRRRRFVPQAAFLLLSLLPGKQPAVRAAQAISTLLLTL